MSEWIPETEVVREGYALAKNSMSGTPYEEALEEFDRWLFEYVRQVLAGAWDEGYVESRLDMMDAALSPNITRTPNPYRTGVDA